MLTRKPALLWEFRRALHTVCTVRYIFRTAIGVACGDSEKRGCGRRLGWRAPQCVPGRIKRYGCLGRRRPSRPAAFAWRLSSAKFFGFSLGAGFHVGGYLSGLLFFDDSPHVFQLSAEFLPVSGPFPSTVFADGFGWLAQRYALPFGWKLADSEERRIRIFGYHAAMESSGLPRCPHGVFSPGGHRRPSLSCSICSARTTLRAPVRSAEEPAETPRRLDTDFLTYRLLGRRRRRP
jgi:hypothetical protein